MELMRLSSGTNAGRRPRSGEDADRAHGSTADCADVDIKPRDLLQQLGPVCSLVSGLLNDYTQKLAASGQLSSPVTVTQQAVVSDFYEAVRQDVKQEAADELEDVNGHPFSTVAVLPIPVREGDLLILAGEQPVVGDGDSVGIASQVGHHSICIGKGRLDVDGPLHRVESIDQILERRLDGGRCSRERNHALLVMRIQERQELATEQT